MRFWLTSLLVLSALVSASVPVCAQTALANLSGEVRGGQGAALAGARVFAENQETGAIVTAVTNASGQYALSFLPRGRYSVRVQAAGYRPFERPDVELPVAAQVVVDAQLAAIPPDLASTLPSVPASQLSRGSLALIYGPDAEAKIGVVDDRPPPMTDATSSTVSAVVDEQRIREIPLAGRDIYTLFVLLPGVTSDNATARGLGFSVNGFPVSSSNYLLDGVDNNNVLTSFPVTLLSPDGIHEYRLASTSFSAEYGRAGFLANVVTQEGSNRWHGNLFEFLIHEKLSANSFQDNASGHARPPFKEHQFGFSAGGPLRKDRLFLFTSGEWLRASTVASSKTVIVPSAAYISSISSDTARDLFQRYPLRPLANVQPLDANRVRGTYTPHVSIDTFAGSARLDYDLRPDRDRLFVRFASFDQSFYNSVKDTYTPYTGLDTPLFTSARNVAVGLVHRFNSSTVAEAKLGWNHSRYELIPPTGLPELRANDGTWLPGAVASNSEQQYVDDVLHAIGNLSLLRGRHRLVLGGEFRPVFDDSTFAPFRTGRYVFANLAGFAADSPIALVAPTDRFTLDHFRAPEFSRRYRQTDFAGFVQDNWRVSRRLTLNAGLRYEYFGVPGNADPAKDVNFYFGSGDTTAARLANGVLRSRSSNTGELAGLLYRKDANNLAPRFGFAFDVFGNSRTVVRGAYGIYYDRPFNLLWDSVRQNDQIDTTFFRSVVPFAYSFPVRLPAGRPNPGFEPAYAMDAGFRTPYVQAWFAGVQHSLSRNLVLEVSQTGSLGRKLAAHDIINRAPDNPSLGEIHYISNQGVSSYLAMQTSLLKRFSRGLQFQVSHTWSHTIDVQGDPLVGPQARERSFQREFDASGDRGNSDFDQRHNLVVHFLWQTPLPAARWLRLAVGSWQLAGIAGYRTGFPFTVFTGDRAFADNYGSLILPRADFLGGDPAVASRPIVAGGRLLLDRQRFANPFAGGASDRLGNTGRNAFRGPGFWNHDLSVSREFRLPRLGEAGRLQFRAECFNLFNHANLGNPVARLDSPSFGVAQFGRKGFESLAVGTSPLNEFPRRVQIVLRLLF